MQLAGHLPLDEQLELPGDSEVAQEPSVLQGRGYRHMEVAYRVVAMDSLANTIQQGVRAVVVASDVL